MRESTYLHHHFLAVSHQLPCDPSQSDCCYPNSNNPYLKRDAAAWQNTKFCDPRGNVLQNPPGLTDSRLYLLTRGNATSPGARRKVFLPSSPWLGMSFPMKTAASIPTVLLLAPCLALAVGTAFYGDPPDATHPWAVHDRNRPQPPVVTPGDGAAAPSDAIVLFDGTDLDRWESTKNGGGGPAAWPAVRRCPTARWRWTLWAGSQSLSPIASASGTCGPDPWLGAL